jgi:integrase
MRIKFSDKFLKGIKATKQVRYFERLDRGNSLVLTVSPAGSRSWSCMRYTDGKSKLHALTVDGRQARYPAVPLAQARKLAVNYQVVETKDAGDSFGKVAQAFFQLADQRGVRTVRDMRMSFARYLAQWSSLPIAEIKRSMIVKLRNDIAYGGFTTPLKRAGDWKKATKLRGGLRTADSIVSLLRAILNHHAEGSDDYVSPMTRSMKLPGGATKRDRTLTDDEIRSMWQATDLTISRDIVNLGPVFAGFCRFALLCGQREAKILNMRWREVDLSTGLWTLPRAPREKPNTGQIVLPPMALSILAGMPRHPGGDLIFSTDGVHVYRSLSGAKRRLDQLMTNTLSRDKVLPGWTIHDLRRTTRTLLSRVGVTAEIGERVLGHVVGSGVAAVYDRHDYLAEKSAALAKVADLVAQITGGNVVQLVAAR